jgi:hypothetical protein
VVDTGGGVESGGACGGVWTAGGVGGGGAVEGAGGGEGFRCWKEPVWGSGGEGVTRLRKATMREEDGSYGRKPTWGSCTRSKARRVV